MNCPKKGKSYCKYIQIRKKLVGLYDDGSHTSQCILEQLFNCFLEAPGKSVSFWAAALIRGKVLYKLK